MNAAQRLEAAMSKVEHTMARLYKSAIELDESKPFWHQRDLLQHAREYANAMRRLARVAKEKS